MRNKPLLYGLLLMMLSATLSHAATYYVAKTGSDSNSCATSQTIGTPKLTIASGRSCLVAGDALHIRTGQYNESIIDGFAPGVSFTNALTVRKHPGDGDVIWQTTGNTSPGYQGPLTLVSTNSHHLIFENIIFDGRSKQGGQVVITGNAGPVGAHHIRFLSCEFRNSFTEISLSYTHDNEFIGGSIHDNNDSTGLRHGIYISSQSSDNIIDGMRIYNNLGYGIHMYNPSGNSDRNIFRNNIVYNNGTAQAQTGIIYAGGTNGLVYNNTVYGNGSGGIIIGYASPASNIGVYNNVIVGNGGDRGGLWVYGGSGHIIRNNIMYQNTFNFRNNASGTTVSNNLNAVDAPGGTNPLFVNSGIRDYHLLAGSPAIDTGFNLTATIPTDQAGTTYTVPMEMGPFNYGTAVPPIVLGFVNQPINTICNETMANVRVCADDANGVHQTSYTTNIGLTIGNDANPTTILTGGTAGAPTAGCKNFTVSLDKVGNGYTLMATSAALTKESNPFNSLAQSIIPITLRLNRLP